MYMDGKWENREQRGRENKGGTKVDTHVRRLLMT